MLLTVPVGSDVLGVPLAWVPNIGATGILVVVVLAILAGKLVPGKERDLWRDAYYTERANNAELMKTAETVRQVLSTVDRLAKVHGESP